MKDILLLLIVIAFFSCNEKHEEFRTVTELPEITLDLVFFREGIRYEYYLTEENDSLTISEQKIIEDFEPKFMNNFHSIQCPEFRINLAFLRKYNPDEYDYTQTLHKQESAFYDLVSATNSYDEIINPEQDSMRTLISLVYKPLHGYGSRRMKFAEVLEQEVVYLNDYAYIIFEAEFRTVLEGGQFPVFDEEVPFHGIITTNIRYPELDKI